MTSPTISLSPRGNFLIHFPAGHHVEFPLSESGVLALRRALEAHEATLNPKIGQEGAPIQYMVDAWIRKDAADKRSAAAKAADEIATLSLEDLGL